MVNILTTASGGLVGQGVLRSLRKNASYYNFKLITGDPDPNARGHLIGDYKVVLPMADDPEYIDKVLEVCKNEKINYIIIGSDTELMNFAVSKERFKKINTKVIVSDPTVIGIADDKYLTAEWLRQNGFPCPKTALLEPEILMGDLSFPIIVKPKSGGRRSYGVLRANNFKELSDIWSKSKTINVAQEELQGDEFTAGVLVVDGTVQAVCVLKRDLRDGNTFNAYHDDKTCDKFIPRLTEIAKVLQPEGPCNFQFRVKDDEPVIFEINARFSGTTPIRYMFGFNEVEELLKLYEYGAKIEQPKLKNGTVFRVTGDVLVEEGKKYEVTELPFGVLRPYEM